MRLLPVFLLALSAFCAEPAQYSAYRSVSLTSAAETVTIQQPATGARRVILVSASVYCSAACVPTFKRNGTAADINAMTVNTLTDAYRSPAAVAFSGSNVGSGTTLYSYNVAAGSTATFDLSGIELRGNGATKNFSISTDSVTATVKIQILWREE